MQNFWIESIKKEASLRLAWQLKYSKAFARQALKKKAANDKKVMILDAHANIKKNIQKIEKSAEKKDQDSGSPSETKKESEALEEDEEDLLNFREMRSPSPKTRSQLYEGISHHGEGRYAYLKARNKKSPEQKYVFPVRSSNVYGWKIHDRGMPKSDYARTRVIRDTFYRYSGIITG